MGERERERGRERPEQKRAEEEKPALTALII